MLDQLEFTAKRDIFALVAMHALVQRPITLGVGDIVAGAFDIGEAMARESQRRCKDGV